jgi:mono/diheme cytochrome c family protein
MPTMPGIRNAMWSVVAMIALATVAAIAFLWSGLYDIGADDPHTSPVLAALGTLRERSIAARSGELQVPDLRDPALIRQGAGNYEAMCSGCHLAPGRGATELSRGLYPAPPNFSKGGLAPAARQFWVVKHGIKASGMPAWGKSMGDRYLWGLVAFVRQLPALDARGYEALVRASPGHVHDGREGHAPHGHDHAHMAAGSPPVTPPGHDAQHDHHSDHDHYP